MAEWIIVATEAGRPPQAQKRNGSLLVFDTAEAARDEARRLNRNSRGTLRYVAAEAGWLRRAR